MINLSFGVIRVLFRTMETKSPYFSPKKTRNLTRKHGSTLLQKIAHSSKVAVEQKEPHSNNTPKTDTKITGSTKNTSTAPSTKLSKGRKKNIRCDAVATVNEICDQQQRSNEKSPTKEDSPRIKTSMENGIKMETLESQNDGSEKGPSTVEICEPQQSNEKTPTKEDPPRDRTSMENGIKMETLESQNDGPEKGSSTVEICEPQQSNEKTPTKEGPPRNKTSMENGIKMEKLESQNDESEKGSSTVEIKIKVEPADEYQQLNEKTPCKGIPETSEPRSSIKRELNDDSYDGNPSKEVKWEPKNWRQIIENIRQMRRENIAPVDTMGCDQFTSDGETVIPGRLKRYHCLVSLILSSQTRDQANHECMMRLKKHGLTPESMVSTDDKVLEKLIYPISFYRNKTKFIKQMSQILIDQYDGDIPNNIKELLKLPGVGKKMAHLCMRSAWNVVTGIGVDTHVHRISNWLQLIPEETKQPEATRKALEKWLPFELWDEFNHLLVGFGQTICTQNFPRCNDCLNAPICPARGKRPIRKTPMKKAIKPEDLEF